jgi:hypothetical protein
VRDRDPAARHRAAHPQRPRRPPSARPAATATTATGLALPVPNLLAAAMLVAFLTALQTQVRLVEEPYLHRVHGTVYDQYAARTGRFLPWIGRQRTGTGPA